MLLCVWLYHDYYTTRYIYYVFILYDDKKNLLFVYYSISLLIDVVVDVVVDVIVDVIHALSGPCYNVFIHVYHLLPLFSFTGPCPSIVTSTTLYFWKKNICVYVWRACVPLIAHVIYNTKTCDSNIYIFSYLALVFVYMHQWVYHHAYVGAFIHVCETSYMVLFICVLNEEYMYIW